MLGLLGVVHEILRGWEVDYAMNVVFVLDFFLNDTKAFLCDDGIREQLLGLSYCR